MMATGTLLDREHAGDSLRFSIPASTFPGLTKESSLTIYLPSLSGALALRIYTGRTNCPRDLDARTDHQEYYYFLSQRTIFACSIPEVAVGSGRSQWRL